MTLKNGGSQYWYQSHVTAEFNWRG